MLIIYRAFQISVFFLLAVLTACMSPSAHVEREYAPSYYYTEVPVEQMNGAILNIGTEVSLFEDIKAKRLGDIVTVQLVEETSGQKSSDSSVNRSTEMGIGVPTFGGSARANMGVDMNSEHAFSGDSGSSQSNKLNGSIAVTVVQVLPGGNLVVEGEKWIQINQGNEYISLRGVIRPKDIDTTNSLLSTQVADARISYSSTGVNNDANRPGWAPRVLFSSIWPF